MDPWFRGFTGIIEKSDEKTYVVSGIFNKRDDRLSISELPLQKWTRDYKNFLEGLAKEDKVKSIKEFHKDNEVRFELKLGAELANKTNEEIEKIFKLSTNLNCTNMVLFDRDNNIKKYEDECEILNEFYEYRLRMYH